jgi:hypothetical protein
MKPAAFYAGCLASLWLSLVSPAQAVERKVAKSKPVAVRVVDLSDDRAYIEPGSSAGIAAGDEVRLGDEPYVVSAVSGSFAMLVLRGKDVALGARGVAQTKPPEERVELALEPPTPLPAFRGEWRTAMTPASTQSPRPVPLGGGGSTRSRSHFTLSDSVYGAVPLTSDPAYFGNELRGRLHYEPYAATPLAIDADLALQTFYGADFALRPGAAARQLFRLRELSLTYGTSTTFRGALGRLRAASSLVGQLDGVRLEAPLTTELRLATYGGAVPHAFNGMLSSQVARFGAEIVYQDAAAKLRPRIVAGAYASRFAGALDEKKAYAAFDLLPGRGRLGGHAQLSFFEPQNPWHAAPVELSAASLDTDIELGPLHFGGRLQLQRPDRSRWLASLLPPEWLCWSAPDSANAPCLPGNATYSWLIDGGVRAGKLTVDWGGHSAFTRGTDASSFGGFANLRWIDLIGRAHLDTGVSVSAGSVLRSVAATLAPGLLFADGRGDVSFRYRPALVRYRATLESTIEHGLGAGLWLALTDALDIDVEGEWLKARELDVVLVQGVAAWSLGI